MVTSSLAFNDGSDDAGLVWFFRSAKGAAQCRAQRHVLHNFSFDSADISTLWVHLAPHGVISACSKRRESIERLRQAGVHSELLRSPGFEVQWNVYGKLCINVLMESILLSKGLAAVGGPRPFPACR